MHPAASSRRKDCDDGARGRRPFSARPYMERSAHSLCLRARGDLASWLLNPSLRYTQPWDQRLPGVLWYTQFSLCVYFADLGIRKVVYTEEDGLGNSPGMDPPPVHYGVLRRPSPKPGQNRSRNAFSRSHASFPAGDERGRKDGGCARGDSRRPKRGDRRHRDAPKKRPAQTVQQKTQRRLSRIGENRLDAIGAKDGEVTCVPTHMTRLPWLALPRGARGDASG